MKQFRTLLVGSALLCLGCSDGDTGGGRATLLDQTPPLNAQQPSLNPEAPPLNSPAPGIGQISASEYLQIMSKAVCEQAAKCGTQPSTPESSAPAECTQADGCGGCTSVAAYCDCADLTQEVCDTLADAGLAVPASSNSSTSSSSDGWAESCSELTRCAEDPSCVAEEGQVLPVSTADLTSCLTSYLALAGCDPEIDLELSEIPACASIAQVLQDSEDDASSTSAAADDTAS